MANPTKQRDSNLELYRVIVMLLIVAHHYVVNSGLTNLIYEDPLAGNSLFLLLFGAWGKTGINCFVLITGYFMCKSKITLKKFAKLFLEVVFYCVVIYVIFLLTGQHTVTFKGLLKMLWPITSIGSNFTGCFLTFYLFIPFLNILIHNLSEKQHLLLLLLCLAVYTVMGSMPIFSITMNYVTWYIILYFIASFIRLHPRKLFDSTKLWGWATGVCLVLSAGSVVAFTWLETKLGRIGLEYYFLSDSNKILAVANGICSFLFFKNLKVKYSKLINIMGGSCFGVLLIHANSDTMRTWLWVKFLKNVSMFDSQWLPVHAFCSVVGIFVVCLILDQVRIKWIEGPFFRLWDKKYPCFLTWYKAKEAFICEKLHING